MLLTVDADQITSITQCLEKTVDEESEAKLTGDIVTLWSAHKENKAAEKRTRHELKELRRNLAERLHTMKNLLARTGRDGQWTGYLRDHKIPRTTADRYVRDHEESLNPAPTNRTSGAIADPTEADVKQFFHRILPRLLSTLTTNDAVYYFVREMHFELPTCNSEMTDQGISVLGSTTQGEVQ